VAGLWAAVRRRVLFLLLLAVLAAFAAALGAIGLDDGGWGE
jgi:hypothetical protein